ncbi:MAG TPA: hypothetical protein VGL42_12555 [Opitutaceae bacterium]
MNTLRLFLLSPVGGVLTRVTVLLALAWMVQGMLRMKHPRWRLILWRTTLVLCALNAGSQIARRIELLWQGAFCPWKWRDTFAGVGLMFAMAIGAIGWGFTNARADEAAVTAQRWADTIPMKHYANGEWRFSLDIPKNWNSFPPVSANSPYEVIRFESRDDGFHDAIFFRNPLDPKKSATAWVEGVQKLLADDGFGNFVSGHATIGSRTVETLDFDRTRKDQTWSVRYYFCADGTLGYLLGFGTNTHKAEMFDLYDRMAKSFRSEE